MAQFFVLSLLYMAVLYRVDGGISISPAVPAMGGPNEAVITCDSSGLEGKSISSMQISRKRAKETKSITLASIYSSAVAPGITPNLPFLNSGSDLTTRDGISLTDSGIQTDNTLVSSLKLHILQVNLLCTDEAEYKCQVSYLNPELRTLSQMFNTNLTIFVPPKDLTLTVTHNGVVPGEGLQSNPTQFNVGDVIQLSCSGSIGSNSNQEFKWRRTPITGFVDFSPYNPDTADENKGTVPTSAANCMYSRTATLSYNITPEDGNRNNVWGFKCEAEYGTQQTQTQSSSAYYIIVEGGNQNQNQNPGTAAASADGGMIAGIVVGVVAVLVLVVILVYFLWYRRRGGAADTYSSQNDPVSEYYNIGSDMNRERAHTDSSQNDPVSEYYNIGNDIEDGQTTDGSSCYQDLTNRGPVVVPVYQTLDFVDT